MKRGDLLGAAGVLPALLMGQPVRAAASLAPQRGPDTVAPSIRGPWSEKRQLMHADRAAGQPNQGGIVEGPDGNWYFFTHHGTGAWEGRGASLLPVHWIDGWPVIGEPGPDGGGTMVWEGAIPLAGIPRQFPQGDDDFNTGSLSSVWEWNYQPRAAKWSLDARAGRPS